jgi:hypothetical protein
MPFSVEEFRKTNEISVKYFDFPIPYKRIKENYIIYRSSQWQQH